MRAWKRYAIAGLASAAAALGLAVPAEAAEPAFQLPFPCGQTWHGNNPDSSAHVTKWEIDFNRGDDLGSPVLAAAAGTVATAANQGSANGYGNLVKISHGSSGYFSYYAHLRDMTVSAGDTVTQGQLIGHVGNTSKPGNAIQPHLHYEVRHGSPYPDNIQPAVFAGVRFPYPDGDVTSKNCGGGQHSAAKSINGDAYDDAVGVDADGVATMYPGTSGGGFGTGIRMGAGWTGFTRIGVADSNADGWADLFAIKAGTLYYWNNHGDGTFTSAVEVGPGWSGFEWVSYADVNGDGKADILARDGGNMYLYPGLGGGTSAPAGPPCYATPLPTRTATETPTSGPPTPPANSTSGNEAPAATPPQSRSEPAGTPTANSSPWTSTATTKPTSSPSKPPTTPCGNGSAPEPARSASPRRSAPAGPATPSRTAEQGAHR
jgi:hypothetical protein